VLRALLSAAGFVLLSGCSVVGVRSGYEQPAYTVVARVGENVEIRRYASRVAAEATVSASGPETGRSEAFRVLFDYISGANQGRSEVAMTTPVEATGTCACADRSESRDRRNSRNERGCSSFQRFTRRGARR
jgi:hypothetical protein